MEGKSTAGKGLKMAEDQRVTGGPTGAAQGRETPAGAADRGGANNAPAGADGGRGQLLTSNLAGRLLMISAERVRQLAKEGWIEKAGKDQFYLVDVVQGYIRFRNDSERRATKSASASRVSDARAREVELRIAERERRLVELSEMIALSDQLVGMFRAELSGLPARVTRDLQIRRTIETAINDILDRIADAAVSRAGMVAEGSDTKPPIAPNAA
ncbi:hypothetical protein [Bradyrhizobium valentinum]|nr:hypothetical protein [Bradyrhizobium valentinum]